MNKNQNNKYSMNFKKWLEYHHEYSNVDDVTEPLKKGDTVRVFHGFDSTIEAIEAARHGLSGKLRAKRKYSYESNTNPKGLFVTVNKKTAQEFAGTGCVIEFIAKYEELSAPVWPEGSYGIQGQYMQTFKSKIDRIKTKKIREKEVSQGETSDVIKNSDNPYLAKILFASTEYQSLFVGDLNPERIISFYEYDNNWQKSTLKEFLNKHKDVDLESDENYKEKNSYFKHEEKVFKPEEEFNGKKFIDELKKMFRQSDMKIKETLQGRWNIISKSKNIKDEFIHTFHYYLWPKQYVKALLWLEDNFK